MTSHASVALRYHVATKHHFHQFARSLGYLDWASQPDPFRRYPGAPTIELPHDVVAADVSYRQVYDGSAPRQPFDLPVLAEFLRCAMGLSAWKQYQRSRWSLRVNPSSGNLHPTELHLLWRDGVYHYAPREHLLEQRCGLGPAWQEWTEAREGFLVALTSIVWREAWKYGERAFRYCQHDVGHAIGALRLSAARLGWRITPLPAWSDRQLLDLLALDGHPPDGAEREEPEWIAAVTYDQESVWQDRDPAPLVAAARAAAWRGAPNQLSPAHVPWPIIDAVVETTRYPGPIDQPSPRDDGRRREGGGTPHAASAGTFDEPPARRVMLQRRSALAFDARSALSFDRFLTMLDRLRPSGCPWDAIECQCDVHLVFFVHRVEQLDPGIYAYIRDRAVFDEWKAALRADFLWAPVRRGTEVVDGLFLLVPTDVTFTANRLSCDQEIAADGFFSLGMLARCESSITGRGEWWYRRLFWECGLIGQVLYLEAEAAGARSTGIGCFYDDAVHEVLGLQGLAWQSLYHFSMGVPAEDARLTTDPGYPWEAPR